MVKRKYIRICFILFLYISCHHADADPQLIAPKSYKYLLTYSTIDSASRKKISEREGLLEDIHQVLVELEAKKAKIIDENPEKHRSNSTQRDIETIEQDVRELEEESEYLSAFSNETFASLDIEYGISENQSFGMKINYSEDKFIDNKKNKASESTKTGRQLDLSYKQLLYKNKRYIFTLQPKFIYSCYNKTDSWYRLDLALTGGYQRELGNYNQWGQIGIEARKYFKKAMYWGYAIHIMEGIKFSNYGIILSNYTEYEQIKTSNKVYSDTLYNQISVAKEFYFDNLNEPNFTAQIGYFWKESLSHRSYNISGPIFSLWFEL